MSRKAISAVAGLMAVALLAAAPASAGKRAPTTVTIKKESDGFFGFVDSTKPNRCANGRKVALYKEKGDSPDPHSDKKIGTDIAEPNGDGYMWSTGNTGNQKGDFYAFTHRITGCKKGISDVVSR
jgi:hypothetical protein